MPNARVVVGNIQQRGTPREHLFHSLLALFAGSGPGRPEYTAGTAGKNGKTMKGSGQARLLVKSIENKGVQTRMLFAGNLVKHPYFDTMRRIKKDFVLRETLKLPTEL
jgi:hypothetical protein